MPSSEPSSERTASGITVGAGPRGLTASGVRLTRSVRLALGVLVLILLGAVGYVLSTVPPTGNAWYPKCTLHSATGLHCPGCGTTRAAHALLNGHIGQAIAYNAIVFLIFPLLPVLQFGARRIQRVTMWFALTAILLFGVLRNVPAEPFSRLAPHQLGATEELPRP
ncbi:DUF2752 domain-containing protein [Gemmata obscuriglobus]|uniref:DUF2752 domain-containing protein n=1 Tax=Gemmata obscuriglobus TaxID=114 RepID=A0A2Z3GY89_9BACT|nr:DUF2752 domain-containing protein [Gemmata obscuriglobus]